LDCYLFLHDICQDTLYSLFIIKGTHGRTTTDEVQSLLCLLLRLISMLVGVLSLLDKLRNASTNKFD
jgi:hypothetical protein